MILQKVYQDGRMSYRGYMNGKVAWDQSVYTRGHATAAALGFAMAQVEKPLSIQMCAAASTVLNGCAIITGFAPEMKAEGTLTGTAEMPDVQEPERVQMAAGGTLQAFAFGYTFGIVYADLCHTEGVLTSNVMAHTADLVYGIGTAMAEGTGFAMPGLADLLNLILSASAETAGTAVAQIQAPEKVLMTASAELTASCRPVTVPVYTVTFMHNGEVLHTQKVLEGYDCPDPVTAGDIDVPTKEMTPQYTYDYSGWTLTEGGEADEAALTNITADTVVYAAFTENVRYYTVTYYDDDGATVLNTESLAYGETPSYIPKKPNYVLKRWIPDIVPVTEDTIYVANWKYYETLDDLTWQEILTLKATGYNSAHVSKTVTLTLNDGTTMDVEFKLIEHDHDDLADGSGKAGMTFISYNAINGKDIGVDAGTSVGSTAIGINKGWAGSTIRKELNEISIKMLPEDLQAIIKPVKKLSAANSAMQLEETIDKIWIPSVTEYGKSYGESASGQGTAYMMYSMASFFGIIYPKAYSQDKNTISTSFVNHITRSNCSRALSYLTHINSSGNATYGVAGDYMRIGFCV